MSGGFPIDAAGSIIFGSDVQLVLIPVQRDGLAVKTDDASDLFDDELPWRRRPADEAESENRRKWVARIKNAWANRLLVLLMMKIVPVFAWFLTYR